MDDRTSSQHLNSKGTPVAIYLAILSLLLHIIIASTSAYGIFRDELYYIACSEHLDWGYVDQPPFSILLLSISRTLFGDSLPALRFLPALAGASVIFLTGLIARELGGGRFTQVLAALAVFIAPVYLSIFDFYSMNSFDILFWVLCFYTILKIIDTENPKLWLLFGVLVGVGLLNKLSILFLCLGIFIGMFFTAQRRFFLSKWLWLSGMIAFVIFLPHLLWQVQHGWPTLEFMRNVTDYKNLPISPIEYFGGQILLTHPFNTLIWIPGLLYLLFSKAGSRYRLFALAYIVAFIVFVMRDGKPYYQSPFYPILFATGGIAIEDFIVRMNWKWMRPALVMLLITGGVISAPMVLPVLPVESLIRYQKQLGLEPRSEERDQPGKLDQHYADMFGWEEMATTVAEVYHNLSAEEQAKCSIFAGNYGEAGAIDFFGRAHGLPNAISGHNNYWLWGPGESTPEVVIIFGVEFGEFESYFESCEKAAVIGHEYARSFETDLAVWVCRGIRMPISEIWPEVRIFI